MYGRDVESMSNRSERRQVLFIFKVSCRFWDKVGEGGGEKRREREREEGRMYFYMAFSERKRGMDRSIGMCVWKVGGRKEKERERSSRLRRGHEGEKEKEKKREGEAVTDQLPRNTNSCRCSTKWRPPLLNLFTPTSTPNYPLLHPAPVFPIVLFDTRPPAPIDLGSLKTRWKPPTTAFAGAA